MKQILNESLQSLQIAIITPLGTKIRRLAPKEAIVVPSTYLSNQAKNLVKRRLVRITDYKE